MSEFAYCPRGGQQGIRVSDEELNSFSDAIGSNALDGTIPLPDMTVEKQKEQIVECNKQKNSHTDEIYWERDNGSHGWCCGKCGTVVQWG